MNDTPPPVGEPAGKSPAARLIDGVYYLALGTWFGAIVMLAISAAAIFRTVRAHHPTLHVAPFDQPYFQERAVPILAGAIVGQAIAGLAMVQILCAILATACVALQVTLWRRHIAGGVMGAGHLLRLALVALPVAVLVLNLMWVTPRIVELRDAMWDQSHSQADRDVAAEQFHWMHKFSERSVGLAGLSLAGAVVVSSLVLGQVRRRGSVAGDLAGGR